MTYNVSLFYVTCLGYRQWQLTGLEYSFWADRDCFSVYSLLASRTENSTWDRHGSHSEHTCWAKKSVRKINGSWENIKRRVRFLICCGLEMQCPPPIGPCVWTLSLSWWCYWEPSKTLRVRPCWRKISTGGELWVLYPIPTFCSFYFRGIDEMWWLCF